MSLAEYHRKRDANHTPEPFDAATSGSEHPLFVVQRHAARSLHYDFRLERHGVLASWAVPKGVPLDPGTRALAVHVEDHPLSYATFEGEIPAGSYGAGTVELWDHGVYELLEEKKDGQLTVALHGKRLNGLWSLVPAHLDGKAQNWLMIKRSDPATAPAGGTQRSTRTRALYRPMLATLGHEPPGGEEWRFELKFDGYRVLAYLRDGGCRLLSRNDHDLTERFAEIAQAVVKATKRPNAVLDGELCRLRADGRSSFAELQRGSGPLVYYVFDLLELDSEPLVERSFSERRQRLEALLDRRSTTVRLSDAFDDGEALLSEARKLDLEGIIAKRVGSRYIPGTRSRDWLKLKLQLSDEFVIAGYTRGAGRREESFGALVLAVNDAGGLRYVGNVGTGFDDAELARLRTLLRPLERASSPLASPPPLGRAAQSKIQWVKPELAAQVSFRERTREGSLRHPVYLGLRDDRPAATVTDPQEPEPATQTLRRGKRELRLSHLHKLFWAERGITKGDLIAYYRDVSAVLVPHLAHRPFTMRRYPDGAAGKAFFQKDAPKHMPEWIPTYRAIVTTRDRARTKRWIDIPIVNDELALLWMVNMGCIDMNAWYSRVDKPDLPDFVLFDLDPMPDVPWTQTVEVALILQRLLDQLALRSFPKTSGGKGLHVLVPVQRRASYEDTRSFASLIATTIAQAHPALATTAWSKAKRRGVLIDANQNGWGKTIASVYSVRPRPDANVSTPLEWDEVDRRLDPHAFTMDTVRARIEAHGDLYAEVLHTPQSLARALASLR